jgi:hypothetical protein
MRIDETRQQEISGEIDDSIACGNRSRPCVADGLDEAVCSNEYDPRRDRRLAAVARDDRRTDERGVLPFDSTRSASTRQSV